MKSMMDRNFKHRIEMAKLDKMTRKEKTQYWLSKIDEMYEKPERH